MVVGEGLGHVLVHLTMRHVEQIILRSQQETGKTCHKTSQASFTANTSLLTIDAHTSLHLTLVCGLVLTNQLRAFLHTHVSHALSTTS